MSLFREIVSDVTPITDDLMGETIQVVPMRSSEYTANPDPARPPFELVGQLTSRPVDERSIGGDKTAMWTSRLAVGQTAFAVDPGAYPAALTVKTGDQMHATEAHREGMIYQVSEIDRGQKARLVFVLNTV